MKKIFIAVVCCLAGLALNAQLKTGDMLRVDFNNENKIYTGETTKVNGNSFSCLFLHSQSVYDFTNLQAVDGTVSKYKLTAKVAGSSGGKYKSGTPIAMNVYRPDYNNILSLPDFNSMKRGDLLAVKFHDGKKYLAAYDGKDELDLIKIQFLHTGSNYTFDQDGVIIKSGGAYTAGKKASFHPAKLMRSSGIIQVGNLSW